MAKPETVESFRTRWGRITKSAAQFLKVLDVDKHPARCEDLRWEVEHVNDELKWPDLEPGQIRRDYLGPRVRTITIILKEQQ